MDKLRMFQWVLLAILLYYLATITTHPQMQIVLWKTGHITVAGFVGYWIDRAAFKVSRIDGRSHPMHHVRRAIVIGCAMLAISMGL